MVDHIFREYDIRGKVGTELVIDQMYDLVRALAYFFVNKSPTVKTVAIGFDGRTHSPALRDETIRALQDSGLNVVLLGMCPTPTLYFSQFTMPVEAGIMITASHNPSEYNGIKIVLDKESVWGKDLIAIRELYKNKTTITATARGICTEVDGVGIYVDYLVDHFAHLTNMKLSAVVDCANAVGGLVFPLLIKKLQWKNIKLLYEEVDGTYPNHEADPVIHENMQDVYTILRSSDYMVGIGLDGDCDRMAPMTKSGYLVPGDQLLALFSQQILRDYPGAAIVFDVKASQGLIDILHLWGAQACISACGHSIIKNEMKEKRAVLGGELSCHFCFKDRYFGYDDGIYAALRLFEIMEHTQQTLDDLISIFPHAYSSPEIRMDCPEEHKDVVVNSVKNFFISRTDTSVLTIDGIRAQLPYGWGLIRASNTQSVLSFRFEAQTQDDLVRVKNEFIHAMIPFFNRDHLEKYFFG